MSQTDSKLSQVNSYFAYRHGKFNLPLKPPTSFSQTRPWRSHLNNYRVYVRNYDTYSQLSKTESCFPDLPEINVVNLLLEFEEKYCACFDLLEKQESNMLDGVKVYYNLIELARNQNYVHLNLESIIVEQLYPIVFSPVALSFYYLSRTNFSCIFEYVDSLLIEKK